MVKEYDVKKLKELVDSKDAKEIANFMKEHNLVINGNNIESVDKEFFKNEKEFLDLRQYVQKIKLNSSYGASLQANSLFYDFRLGSSTTLSGRQIVKHLTSKANELLCGKYEVTGYCAQYNDTDSVYCYIDNEYFEQFHKDFDYTKENLIQLSNDVTEKVNASFPAHMKKIFNCSDERSKRASAAKECVAERGLFVAKKRYAMLVYEHDGFRKDVNSIGELKVMGIQIKRSDTHPLVKELLKKMLNSVLTDGSKEKLIEIMRDFGTNDWSKLNAWDKGTPRTVNKLDFYTKEYNKSGKCSVGQVMASINWNRMLEMMGDKKSPKILDGDKVIVCKMKPNNPFGYKSIALPNTITRVPKWFKQLPFDEQSMVDSAIDKTIETVFGVLNWDLRLSDIMDNKGVMDDFLTYVS